MSEQDVRNVMMRYLDGEASPSESAEFEARLQGSTELRRELALYRSMKDDLSSLPLGRHGDQSVWDTVSLQLVRPAGWMLIVAGSVAWLAYGVYIFLTSDTAPWEQLATAALVIGAAALLASTAWDSYRAWRIDPYKDVHR